MNAHRTHLLIIDPQNDFCDLPEHYCLPARGALPATVPSLPVPGAHADMLRLAQFIDAAGEHLDDISITLDSHQHFDIGHPSFWQHGDGAPVSPFTEIRAADVLVKTYVPRRRELLQRVIEYLKELEGEGRYVHMVWPAHCEIGTWGHGVHDDLRRAYNRWEEQTLRIVHKIPKGQNPYTEHYSAVQAEVPDPDDPGTQCNAQLLADLRRADHVYIAGEAGSHCVKATTTHIVAHLPEAERGQLVLLTDCMSPVHGFEAAQTQFLEDMSAAGVRLLQVAQALDELASVRAR